jgi:hypothetical protein
MVVWVPILYGASAMVGSAAVSVGVGIALDKLTCQETTTRSMAGDAVLGATPVGYAGHIGKTGFRLNKNRKLYNLFTKGPGRYGQYVRPSFMSEVVRFGSKQELTKRLALDSIGYAGAMLGSAYGYNVGVNYALDQAFSQHSRCSGSSLTSIPKGPGTGTTSGAKRTKRTLSPRLSKGDNVRRSSRRRTSFCKIHNKYDFCKHYKK